MDSLVATGVALFIISTGFLLRLLWARRTKYANMPPSPPTWPLLGNLPLLFSSKQRLDVLAKEIGKKYGGIITLWFGPVPFVVITEEGLCRDAFVNNAAFLSNRLATDIISYLSSSFKGIVFSPHNKQLMLKRKWSHQVLKTLLLDVSDGRRDVIKEKCQGLVAQLGSQMEPDVDVTHIILQTMIRITSTACFGEEFAEEDENVKEVEQMLDYIFRGGTPGRFLLLGIFPSLRHVPLLKMNYFKKYKEAMDKISQKGQHDRSLKYNNEARPDNMIDCFAQSCADSNPEDKNNSFYQDDEEKTRIIGDLFVAGSETVTATIMWCILILAKFPKVQNSARDGVEQVATVGKGLQSAVVSDFPYMRAFISEVFRFVTVAPFPALHVSAGHVHFHGYEIPSETVIIPNIYALHHDDEIWKDPFEFRPERFLKDDGSYFIPSKSFIPFGVGPRVCVGELVAKKEVTFVLVYLLLSFTIKPGKDGLPGFDEDPKQNTVLHPKPFKVVLQKRENGTC